MKADYVIVGSGLTGATIARMLTDTGREVVVFDRRSHLGGNVHDHRHASGIRIHTYGPHYFRTSSEKIWDYVTRFAEFAPYVASLQTIVDGNLENWPIAASYIRRVIGETWEPSFRGEPANFEEASLAMMPELIYRKFVKGYTEKQWGVPALALSAALARRFDVREDDDPRLMKHKHQGIPREGYTAFMKKMLAGIDVSLNYTFTREESPVEARKLLIFTGPIDEFFNCDLGRLRYRTQRREHVYMPETGQFQPCGQVNNPDPNSAPHIRTLEWKHMMPAEQLAGVRGTVITRETTIDSEEPDRHEYPFPDQANAELYTRYRERANAMPKLLVCGRLGEYRYYDMDQAIGHAMSLVEGILAEDGNSGPSMNRGARGSEHLAVATPAS
jgi:UDP-galactopyranose mutase